MTFEYTTIDNGVLEVHSRTEAFSCDDLPYGQDRICSRNQPVISNKGNGSCSMKQLGPLVGLLPIAPRQPYVITCMRLYNVIDWQCDNVTNIVVHYISKQLLQFYNTFIFPIIIHNDKYKTYFTRLIRLIYYIAYG